MSEEPEEEPSHPPCLPVEVAPDDKISYKARRKLRNPERKRHGARNQDKSKLFSRWLLQTFREQLKSHLDADQVDRVSSTPPTVLDVAGGKGELAARLCVCQRLKVILVDPRPCDPLQCFLSDVCRQLPQFWQARLRERTEDDPEFLVRLFRSSFQQLQMHFDATSCEASPDLVQAIERSSLLVGLHADGATEAIVDAALRHQKPFCVVPCCVFPSFFPHRTVVSESGSDVRVPVRTHEQFCQYLLDKDPRLRRTVLPFEGRNVVIWWDGT